MTPGTLIHTVLLIAVIAGVGVVATDRAPAAQPQLVGGDATARSVILGKGKSLEYDFPRDIKDVLVADPKIANAVIRSSRRAYIIGIANGSTNIVFFDAEGKQIAKFDIGVAADVNVIRTAIRKLLPGVTAEVIGDGIMLTGTVSSPAEAQQACDIASHFIGGVDNFAGGSPPSITAPSGGGGGGVGNNIIISNGPSSGGGGGGGGVGGGGGGGSASCKMDKVVNAIVVSGRDQVMLQVTVAEMDRNVAKQLGINLSGSVGYGAAVVNFNTLQAPTVTAGNINPFPINGPPSSSIAGSLQGVTANLQAMEQVGVVRTLAEPRLTAISGESAHFLAGGMFPYPVPASLGQAPAIQFQNFGVGLNFTPVVLSEGRISLHVSTEVSQLDPQNSVTIAGTTVPGLTVRRADTTAEISSGGTLVMAGMLEDQSKQAITGLPGLMEVPILGPLFKSRDYLNSKTELVVLVTPYIAHATAQKDLSRPDDGFADASDPASVLLGRLNRIYGVNASPPPSSYHGHIGFILD